MVVFETLGETAWWQKPMLYVAVGVLVAGVLAYYFNPEPVHKIWKVLQEIPSAWDAFVVPIAVIAIAGGIVYVIAKPEARAALIAMFTDPKVLKDVGIAVATLLVLIGVYLYVLRPTIVMGKRTSIMQKCPDRWSFNPKNGYCEPRYETKCRPFKAGSKEVRSYAQQCDLAKSCGTNWGGVCE